MKNAILFLVTTYFLYPAKDVNAQMSAGNKPSRTHSRVPLDSGPSVYGVFEGRPPCQELAKQLNIKVTSECIKLKWGLTLYQDSITHQPTTYKLEGSLFREHTRNGKWSIIQGTRIKDKAIVFRLDAVLPQQPLFLLKGDDNVFFILDKEMNLLAGDADFSYTLNRVTN